MFQCHVGKTLTQLHAERNVKYLCHKLEACKTEADNRFICLCESAMFQSVYVTGLLLYVNV